jgi:hypothetical protein
MYVCYVFWLDSIIFYFILSKTGLSISRIYICWICGAVVIMQYNVLAKGTVRCFMAIGKRDNVGRLYGKNECF